MKQRRLAWACFALLSAGFAVHLARLGVFSFPLLADDYLFAYTGRFGQESPSWAPELLPYWRPLSQRLVLPWLLAGGSTAAPAAHGLAFLLMLTAGAFQLVAYRRLGLATAPAVALVGAFFLASWQGVLVGWASALQDGLALAGVSASLALAARGGLAGAVVCAVAGALSKETAIVALPVIVAVAWTRSRSRPPVLHLGAAGAALLSWVTVFALSAWGRAPQVAGVSGRYSAAAPLLSFLNLADLPAPPASARWEVLGPALILGTVLAALLLGRAVRSTEGREQLPDGTPSRLPWLAAALTAAVAVAGAAMLRYPWSSYLIAPLWPALAIPIATLGRRASHYAAFALLVVAAPGAMIEARSPVRTLVGESGVPTLGSYWSPGRLRLLSDAVGPVERVALARSEPGTDEYYVEGMPRRSWHALASGLAGAIWAGDPRGRARPWEDLMRGEPGRGRGVLVFAGYRLGRETGAIEVTAYASLRGILGAQSSASPERAGAVLDSLEATAAWSALPAHAQAELLGESGGEARARGLDSTAAVLLQAGCSRFAGSSCCQFLAEDLILAGEFEAAERLLDSMVESGSERGDPHLLRALVRVKTARPDKAREDLARVELLGYTSDYAQLHHEILVRTRN